VGTKAGVWKTRTVQRKPKENRWCQSNAEFVGGVPWRTNAELDGEEADGDMPDPVIKIEPKVMVRSEEEEVKAKIEVPRSFAITRSDLEKHGYTAQCLGCKARIRGATRQPHSVECRERMRKVMESEHKVKEAKEKETDFHVKVYEDMQERLKKKAKADARNEDHDPEARSSGAGGRDQEEQEEAEVEDSRRVKRRTEEEVKRIKRTREDDREREQVEEEIEDHEEFDEDGDLKLNWIEFGIHIDGVDMVKEVNVEEFADSDLQDEVIKAYDDVTGQKLNLEDLRKARREEIDFIEAKGIWEKVPTSLCYEKTGKAPTSGKWVDVQKEAGVRSRYVGRDFKPKGEDPRAEIFASMPPLEAKKILFSRAASQIGEKRKLKLLFIDIKKAHMNAVCK